MRHLGNLTVTPDTALSFPAVQEFYGHLTITKGTTLIAPSLTMVRGWVTVEGELTAPKLGLIDGWLNCVSGSISAIHLAEVRQDLTIDEACLIDLPALVEVGSIGLLPGANKKLVALKTVHNNVSVMRDGILLADRLETIGRSITLRERAVLDVESLAHIGGYYDGDASAVLVAPKFASGG